MRRTWIALGGSALFLLVAGFWACSGEQVEVASPSELHGIPTPLGVAEEAAEEALEASHTKLLKLDQVGAFLSQPRYEATHRAAEDARFVEAREAYENALGADLRARTLDAEQWFQLGHLRRLAEDPTAASEAFEEAARFDWQLSGYAQYFAARARFDSQHLEATVTLLADVPNEMPFTAAARLLRAEALLLLQRKEEAYPALRTLLSQEPLPDGWARAALLLSTTLLDEVEAVRKNNPIAPPVSPPVEGSPSASDDEGKVAEALRWARRVALQLAGTRVAQAATAQEQRALSLLPQDAFVKYQALSAEQQLVRLEALFDQGKYEDALVAADELLGSVASSERFGTTACEARVLKSKSLAASRKWSTAADVLTEALRHCQGEDLRARALYLAGKYSQIVKRYSAAVRHYAALEKEAPAHRLADDARLKRAHSYLELGDRSRFTQLLSTIVEDYPDGDMVLDGAFELALHRIERGDWAQASNVLERALPKARVADASRDHEYAGRERYFRARAWVETGETERGLSEYEALIRERPLSYYMQHAYSRLLLEDEARARRVRDEAIASTREQPFAFAHRPEFETPSFQRAIQLVRHGELSWAELELDRLNGRSQPELLWAIALLYNRAGVASKGHQLARGQLTDWLSRWPVGDWEAPWRLAFPRPYEPLVQKAANQNNVPESLIYAVMREESAFRPDVVSPADAYGLMQLIKPTAKHFAKKLGLPYHEGALKRPSVNIALGARVLSDFGGYFPEDPLLAIPGYNAGPGRPRRWRKEHPQADFDVWVELIPFNETRRYTKRVLASRGAYAFLYESKDSPNLLIPRKLSSAD